MTALDVLARLFCLGAPLAFAWAIARRLKRPAWLLAVTFALGAAAFVPAWIVEGWLRHWSGIDDGARGAELVALVYGFLVAAPLEQGLKVAAFAPAFRTRGGGSALDGVLFAGAAALGFVSARDVFEVFFHHPTGFGAVLRALVAVPAHVFFAALWGYALGRDPRRRFGGRTFNLAWLVATVFNAVFDDIAFARSLAALIATVPILLSIVFFSWLGARDLLHDEPAPSRPSFARRLLPAIARPSIHAMRAALQRSERPIMLRWIGVGAMVTIGVMTAALGSAVAVGHRLGLDFAAVDRVEATSAATAPLALLGAAALAAFPFAGYLVARASDARSVLEPAIGAALAIAGVLVLLGLAAPLAVVFAVAFAPVAFGLACAGAWMGMSR